VGCGGLWWVVVGCGGRIPGKIVVLNGGQEKNF
jgi:hypothetical protein